jgi:dTMP kinase
MFAHCCAEIGRTELRLYQRHEFSGKLFVVEGVDGSGKSTQLDLLRNWLESRGKSVIFTEWNSSKLISKTIKQAKRSNSLIPVTFSILHATDFADRLENIIVPALKAGLIVLADRYCFTAFARDVARGVDREWVRNLYGFSIQPDGTFYFQVPVEVSLERIANSRMPGFYESGMDIGLSRDPKESFQLFQTMIINEYDKMVSEFNFHTMTATRPIHEQQLIFRETVAKLVDV